MKMRLDQADLSLLFFPTNFYTSSSSQIRESVAVVKPNMGRFYIFIVFLTSISRSLATCFYPNGTPVEVVGGKEVNQPCNKTAGVHSMCCLLDDPKPNTCNSDGLCIPFDNGFIYRDTCTDPTWEDPACLKICTDGQSKAAFPSDVLISCTKYAET